MNKLYKLALVFSAAALSIQSMNAQSIVASQDTYIRNGSHANTNYGSDESIFLKDSGTNGFERWTYLGFDVSSITDPIDTVSLDIEVITLSSSGSQAFTLYGITNTWDEATLTWNNAPFNDGTGDIATNGTNLGDFSLNSTDTDYSFISTALTSFVSSNDVFTIVLAPGTNSGNVTPEFYSSENLSGGLAPTLTIATAAVPEPSTYAMIAGLLGFVWVMIRRRK